jgi:ferredoxin-NADP reductase
VNSDTRATEPVDPSAASPTPAASRRLVWRTAYLVDRKRETSSASTLVLGVPGWPGHLAGQHVDVRLTAADGYSTQRSYSLAAPDHGARIELTVQVLEDGEVSPFLVDDYAIGDPVEIRGPVGGWFVWRPDESRPVLLVAGGAGIVPLMAMIRARHESGNTAPMRLLYSARTPDDVIYAAELARRAERDDGLDVRMLYSRQAPPESPRRARRLDAAELEGLAWPLADQPLSFICGPTGFVDTAASVLSLLGHPDPLIRTERFG